MKRSIRILCIVVAAAISSLSNAIFPIFIDDVELAHSPVIVVGYWPKAAFTSRFREENKVITAFEAITKLNITQVLHGRISPGLHQLLLTGCVSWDKNGRNVTSATSSEMPGEVDDVSKPCIWFLDITKSWKKEDKKEYLHIRTYRCIQYPKYLPVYENLRRPDRNSAIRSSLESQDSDIVNKALNFVAGGREPWPFHQDYSKNPNDNFDFSDKMLGKPKQRVFEQLATLKRVIDSGPSKSRGMATALYSEMKGKETIPLLKSLLQNSGDDVRTVAACHLVRFGETSAAPLMEMSLRPSSKDSPNSCELIFAIEKTKNLAYVPVLIQYLQTKSNWESGDELSKPAEFARRTLTKLTSFTFPFDVAASRSAWQVANRESSAKRQAKLLEILGSWDNPIEISFKPIRGKDGKLKKTPKPGPLEGQYQYQVWLHNRTNHAVTIRRKPYSVCVGGGSWTYNLGETNGFIVLQGGQTYECVLSMQEIDLEKETVVFTYSDPGQKFGYKAWMGHVDAKPAK